MIGLALRTAVLTVVYLLFLGSLALGDVVIGFLLGLAVASALHPGVGGRLRAPRWTTRLRAAAMVVAITSIQVITGSWRVMRFCLRAPGSPGLIEVPRGERSRLGVALWGLLTGEAPDEVPVDFDPARDMLIVHTIDASNPDAVRERHRHAYERWQRKVVP